MLINGCNLKPKLNIYSLNSYLTEKGSFIKLEILVGLTEFVRALATKSCRTRFRHQHENKRILCCPKREVGKGARTRFPSSSKARRPKWHPSPRAPSAPAPRAQGWMSAPRCPGRTGHQGPAAAASAARCPTERQGQAGPGKLPHAYDWLSNRRRSSPTPAVFLQGLQSKRGSLVLMCQHTRQPAPFKHKE